MSGDAAPVRRHSKYFQEFAIFQVEDVLFKIPTDFLTRDSSVFEQMFSCPSGSEGAEGQCEERPIVIPGVKVEEFEVLMDFYHEWMEPTSVTRLVVTSASNEAESSSDFGKGGEMTDRLFTLLSVSTKFCFDKVRELVLAAFDEPGALSSFSPTERILLASKYRVEQWERPAYVDLCQQSHSLDSEDVEALGWKTVLLMAAVRERYRHRLGHLEGYNKRYVGGPQVTLSDRRKLAEEGVVEVFFPHLKPAAAIPETSAS